MIHKAKDETVPDVFFRRDYQDRGMIKWAGFFLSDHTNAIKKMHKDEEAEPVRPRQSIDEKSEIIYDALFGHKLVAIQMSYVEGGNLLPIIEGIVESADEGKLWVKKVNQEQATQYEVDDIRNIQIVDNPKWENS